MLNKSKIEWCDYSINPVKGLCPMACPYCYARRMYKRFKWNPEIRYEPSAFNGLPSEPARVFVGSTMELFGDWIDPYWMDIIFEATKLYSQHTFIFLTKQPHNLIKWSPFPDNCWVGESIVEDKPSIDLLNVQARVRFISFEPLRGRIDMSRNSLRGINWVIIGAQTPYSKKTAPSIEWVKEIVEAADKAKIPIFLKNNLLELVNYQSPETEFAFNKEGYYRQEFPVIHAGQAKG